MESSVIGSERDFLVMAVRQKSYHTKERSPQLGSAPANRLSGVK